MENISELHNNGTHTIVGFLGGMLLGGLAGATAMLLYAPQSGKRTRAKIMQKTIELRDTTSDAVGDAMMQTRRKARQIKKGVFDQAEALQQRGQEVVDAQKERLSTLVEAGKTAVQDVLS